MAPENHLHFRIATASDAAYIDDLTRRTMIDYVSATWSTPEEVERYFAKNAFDPSVPTWLVCSGPHVAGRLTLCRGTTPNGEKILVLDNIHIEPAFQGQSLGRQAIEQLVLSGARREGLSVCLLVLKSNPAKRLYERLGFHVVGESDTRYFMGWQTPAGFAWDGALAEKGTRFDTRPLGPAIFYRKIIKSRI